MKVSPDFSVATQREVIARAWVFPFGRVRIAVDGRLREE